MTEKKQRIYIVTDDSDTVRMIEASNARQAVRHVIKNKYNATLATQHALIEMTASGIKLEKAADE